MLDHPTSEAIELNLRHKDGSVVPVRFRGGWVNPKFLERGAIWLAEDLSSEHKNRGERERLISGLEFNIQRVTNSQIMAKMGDWDLDPTTDDIWWFDQVYRIFGLEPGEIDRVRSPTARAECNF